MIRLDNFKGANGASRTCEHEWPAASKRKRLNLCIFRGQKVRVFIPVPACGGQGTSCANRRKFSEDWGRRRTRRLPSSRRWSGSCLASRCQRRCVALDWVRWELVSAKSQRSVLRNHVTHASCRVNADCNSDNKGGGQRRGSPRPSFPQITDCRGSWRPPHLRRIP